MGMNETVKKDLMVQISKEGEPPWFTICVLEYADDGYLSSARAKTWEGRLHAKDLPKLTSDWFTWEQADDGLLAVLRRAQSNMSPL